MYWGLQSLKESVTYSYQKEQEKFKGMIIFLRLSSRTSSLTWCSQIHNLSLTISVKSNKNVLTK